MGQAAVAEQEHENIREMCENRQGVGQTLPQSLSNSDHSQSAYLPGLHCICYKEKHPNA